MSTASRILIAAAVAVGLAACARSTQENVDNAVHDRAAAVAKAEQGARPAVDAANRDLAKAKQNGDVKVADASADANRAIDKATLAQSREQAKADYDVAIAKADGDLKIAREKCTIAAGDAKSACEQEAQTSHDQRVSLAKDRLDSATTAG